MKSTENVLCAARNALPADWLGEMSAVAISETELYQRFPPVCFLPRSDVENDPAWKQIIPYLIVRNADKTRVVCYQRNGAENRLHDLWSIGIGGHISAADDPDHSGHLKTVVQNGLYREMSEELLHTPSARPDFLGIIHEEITQVGSVHLGLVFCLNVDEPETIRPGDELFRFSWAPREELNHRKLEYWSKLALQLSGITI